MAGDEYDLNRLHGKKLLSQDAAAVDYNSNWASMALRIVQQQIQGLECSVCGQIVDPRAVAVCNLLRLKAWLKLEGFALCPSCTQGVSPDLQLDAGFRARWKQFVSLMPKTSKPGVHWYSFRPKTER